MIVSGVYMMGDLKFCFVRFTLQTFLVIDASDFCNNCLIHKI